MNEVNNIPEGWVETTLRKVGKVITGKTPSKNNFSEITKIDTSGGFELRAKLAHHQTRYQLR